jgi:DNA-binding CsgD family transcriptional regulator
MRQTLSWTTDATARMVTATRPLPLPPPSTIDDLLRGLHGLAHGIAVIDIDGTVDYANAAAHALFEQAHWRWEQGGWQSTHRDEQQAWLAALRAVALRARRELFELVTDGGCAPIVLSPIGGDGRPRAFLAAARRELCGEPELRLYAKHSGLTGAETTVLVKLADGMRASEIARAHGVALNTVHSQISSVRAKTSCASVRQLIATLARLPALRPLLG